MALSETGGEAKGNPVFLDGLSPWKVRALGAAVTLLILGAAAKAGDDYDELRTTSASAAADVLVPDQPAVHVSDGLPASLQLPNPQR